MNIEEGGTAVTPYTDEEMKLFDSTFDPSCSYCRFERDHRSAFHPRHRASDRCESGKHAHCSCDTCF